MKIAVIGSDKGTAQVKKVLVDFLDNITVECFEDTSQYVHIVSTRNWKIDRIIILQDGIPKADTRNSLMRFQQFVDECNLKTNIIFIVKDLTVASNLSDIFVSIYHCIFQTMTIKPTQIVHLGSKPIEDLREDYGYKIKELTNTVSDLEVIGGIKEDKPKKKGIFGGLFSKKDKNKEVIEVKEQKNEEIETINELPSLDDELDTNMGVPKFDDTLENNAIDAVVESNRKSAENFYNTGVENDNTLEVGMDTNNLEIKSETRVVIEPENSVNTIIDSDDKPSFTKMDLDAEFINNTKEVSNNSNKHSGITDTKNNVEDTILVSDDLFPVYEQVETTQIEENADSFAKSSKVKEININNTEDSFNETLTNLEEDKLFIPNDNNNPINDNNIFEDVTDLDIDIELDDLEETNSDIGISNVSTKLNELSNKLEDINKVTDYVPEESIVVPEVYTAEDDYDIKSRPVEEVQETTFDLNIAKLEAELKSQEVSVIPSNDTSLESVTSKKRLVTGFGGRRNIIFTGDRGTGITSTALTVASMLARKEPTLFVDFDIEHNGFVYYATIDNIIEEDDYVQASLVHLNRFDNIKAVTYNFHKGGFDVLMSFFDSGAVDDDISRVQKILTLQKTYKNVIIDCPIDKIHLLRDLIEQSSVMICTRIKLKTLITTLKVLNGIDGDSLKYNLYKNSKFVITDGQHPEYLLRSLLYIKDLFSLDEEEIDWTDIPLSGSTSNMMELLKDIVE